MIVEKIKMEKWLGIILGILLITVTAFTVSAFSESTRLYSEESEPTAQIVKTVSYKNEADLVRLCAEITQTVEETIEETAEEITETVQDENLALWLAKAGEYRASEEIVEFLYETMKEAGIEQMMPYAMAQCFQESMFITTAENKLDKGILQYRITYWPSVCREHGFPEDTSIFDWRTQIRIYTADMARRLASGLSIEETISRHKQSDYGPYDSVYVEHVMRWVK